MNEQTKKLVEELQDVPPANCQECEYKGVDCFDYFCKSTMKHILKVLKAQGLVFVDKDAELPQRGIGVCANCWITTQRDMFDEGYQKTTPIDVEGE